MNIDNLIEESKRKSALINSLLIDWQYAQQLIIKVLNEEAVKTTPDFKIACNQLKKILTRQEDGIRELNHIIPAFAEESEEE